jgi:IclR family transcriptional regulator, acetate operon repressor
MRSEERNTANLSMLGRSATLLLAFGSDKTHMTLAELCRHSGIPKGTAHRLVVELEKWGFLERSGSQWTLGMRLFELGQLVPTQRTIGDVAAPYLADLFEATKQTVHLAVIDGFDAVYLQKLARRDSPPLGSRVGGRMPLYCTGVGKALLAFNPEPLTEAVIAGGLRRRTPRTIAAPGLLRQDLARTRARGFAVEREESAVGIACVAAPVLDLAGNAIAAISITGRLHRFSNTAMTAAARTAALGLSRALRANYVD